MAERETRASNEAPPEYVVRRGADLGADVDDLVVVYAAATSPNGQDVRARREVMLRHARAPDAVGVLAVVDGGLVGFCYGTRSQPGQWWHDHVNAAVSSTDRDRWLRDAFVICELAVHPDHQGAGIGTELVSRVLALPEARRRDTVLLSADMDNPVDALYRRFGFEDVVEGLPFTPDATLYRIMGRPRSLAR